MQLTADVDNQMRDVTADIVRRSGIRPTKVGMQADIIRAFFALASQDETIRDRTGEYLRQQQVGK